ncbi:MAG: hypothetical protein KTR24_18095 [Saprospiraceae bacterium]|nr:hypothetical protein [Saprospiraceae bacterium]
MPVEQSFHANGKVLISGEYLVLDGAVALGLPTSLGQGLTVKESSGSDIVWESYAPDGSVWFSAKMDLFGFDCIKTTDEAIASTLSQILEACVRLNSDFLSKWKKYKVKTHLDFDPKLGLGSSSTLISCIAEWADVDPFALQAATFGGSGYDIACARAANPIFYQVDGTDAEVKQAHFSPNFCEELYFVYLGQKQNTREELESYKQISSTAQQIDEISNISKSLCEVHALKDFSELMENHEAVLGELLGKIPIRKERFSDYWGAIKSLGAWGGDLVMVTSDRSKEETQQYFEERGCPQMYSYCDLAISK